MDAWIVAQYMPDDPFIVDRQFFWAIFLKLNQDKAERYIQRVIAMHNEVKPKPAVQKNYVSVHTDFLDELLEFEQKPRKLGLVENSLNVPFL